MTDFWLSCGHHLLDRDEGGGLVVTDAFLKVYLARPELIPPPEACAVERTLHAALLADPRMPVATADIEAIADADARENWQWKFWMTPCETRTSATTNAIGNRMRVTARVKLTRSCRWCPPGWRAEPPDQRDRDREADRGRQMKLPHREPGHLGEVTDRALGRVILPVGVGDEAHRGVEGQETRHALDVRRVQREVLLHVLQHEEHDHREQAERERVRACTFVHFCSRTGSMPPSR